MVRGIAHFAGSVLLIVAVTGCASLQGRGNVPAGPSRIEAKLMEINRTLDEANQQSAAFYVELRSVIEEISEFRSRPYWNEFEQVLLEYPTLKDPDNELGPTPEMKSRFSKWSIKWKTEWEQTLKEYHILVDRCTILEAKRLAAREKLLAVQAGYLAVVIMQSTSGHEKEGKEIYSAVESLDKAGAELDSYQPDDLGLYAVGPGK